MRRRSRERDQRMIKNTGGLSPERLDTTAPNCKPCLTPLNLDKPTFRTKLQRGQPNATSSGLEKPLPSPVMDSATGKARIKMSFKERDRPQVKVNGPVPMKVVGSPKNSRKTRPSPSEKKLQSGEKKKLSHGDSITSLRNDINEMIEKSFGDEMKGSNTGNDDIDEVFNNSLDQTISSNDVNDLSSKIENISFKNSTLSAVSPLKQILDDDMFVQSSPVTRSQMRRVSDGFQFVRPDDVPQERTDTLRRQSSAFEFRSKFASQAPAEPTYENLARDVATRGSLRRRNSSVRDLVQKIESETKKRSVGPADVSTRLSSRGSIGSNSSISASKPPPALSTRALPDIKVEVPRTSAKKPPLRISENDEEFADGWVDASEFFKNVTQAEAPQCGRSSIVKIRTQNQGRVKDIGTKFNQPGATPGRGAAARRLSARMGTTVATPGHVNRPSKLSSTLSSLPPTPGPGHVVRRQTLTGIKTSVTSTSKRTPATSANYANPTISSNNKVREKSPLPSGTRSKSPHLQQARSPKEPSYQNVKVERKNSTSRDIKKVERSSSSGSKPRKNRVRRNKSDADRRSKRKEERRYLTIGYPGEMRSPLKERQNIPANVRRSESDRTPMRSYKEQEKMVTRSQMQEVENRDYENININVVRKHSLKSDMLMSPKVRGHELTTPASSKHVKRTASERSTPKTAPYNRSGVRTPMMSLEEHRRINMDLIKKVSMESTPRRSPRFSMI